MLTTLTMSLAAALFVAPTPSKDQKSIVPIIDYLVQDVCLDSKGVIIQSMTPVDPKCRFRRNLTDKDLTPYHLTKVLSTPGKCGQRRLIRDNLLWSHNGVTRAVGAVQIEKDMCARSEPIPAYYSVRWADQQYAFIMGAWSRGKEGGSVGGGITPQCINAPHTSRRYFQNWALASTNLIEKGQNGYGVFSKRGSFNGLPELGTDCPSVYPSRYLAIWSRGDFMFTSGHRLDTIISHPYSQVDGSGQTPGLGKQMERTYWTKEFGQSRWESWKREDYFGRKAGKDAQQLADAFNETGVCSPPFDIKGFVTPSLKLNPVEYKDGVYSQVATDIRTGESHRWIMASCQDMTNTIPSLHANGDASPSVDPVSSQFWDFWAN